MTKELSSQGGSSSALSTQSATWPRAPGPTIQPDKDRNRLTVRPRESRRGPRDTGREAQHLRQLPALPRG